MCVWDVRVRVRVRVRVAYEIGFRFLVQFVICLSCFRYLRQQSQQGLVHRLQWMAHLSQLERMHRHSLRESAYGDQNEVNECSVDAFA